MDLEELSASQIVLLTLLVSFVTSIATGVITASLMQQAPPAIAQTVNRVIQQTVEKVASDTQNAASAASQKTVYVPETNQIATAVSDVSPSLVRIYPNGDTSGIPLALGVVVGKQGIVMTDASALSGQSETTVVTNQGDAIPMTIITRDSQNGLVYLSAATSTAEQWTPAQLASALPSLGDTVVVLSGGTISRIAQGLVTALVPRAASSSDWLSTDIAASSIQPGSPLIDAEGVVIGISTGLSRAADQSSFLPVSSLGTGTDQK